MPARACGFKSHPEYQKETLETANAEIAQLVEHDLAKVGVASSSLVFRSKEENIEIIGCNPTCPCQQNKHLYRKMQVTEGC